MSESQAKLRAALAMALSIVEQACPTDRLWLPPVEAMRFLPGLAVDEGGRRRQFQRLRKGLDPGARRMIGNVQHVDAVTWILAVRGLPAVEKMAAGGWVELAGEVYAQALAAAKAAGASIEEWIGDAIEAAAEASAEPLVSRRFPAARAILGKNRPLAG